ncbi:MAG: crossover junction endodeoxyribonuclease RuvC [Massiliimalia sp.]|jgi:crossover junction endodeoxyribonuclease RuvC
MRIIGVDPGYAIVGVGVLEYQNNSFRTLDYGAITTPAGMEFSNRLKVIFEDFSNLLDLYKPDAIAVERLYFTTNQKTAIDVAQARGVILLAASLRNIPCYEYTPLQVKLAVVGYGKAVKKQVMEMTTKILNLKEVPKPDDVADALAIAVCHAHTSPSRRNFNLLQKMR